MRLCVVGGGPAGLAFAIEARLRGASVALVEQRSPPIDKACGEGIMPSGLLRLSALGVSIDPARTHPIAGIRYINEDGTVAQAPLPFGGGLGVRRLALSDALFRRAREVGVELHQGQARWAEIGPPHRIDVGGQPLVADALIAADGLQSPLRRQAGLARPVSGDRRFGLRCHFRVAPWTDHVEIHFAEDAEAYVTPVGPKEIGVAFLWSPDGRHGFEELLARFPLLAIRLAGAEPTSKPAGLGPLAQRPARVIAPGFALLGDAAGYVDAITGEGISLALECAHTLSAVIAANRPLDDYARAHARAFRRYEGLARALLWLAARPRLRRFTVTRLASRPRVFAGLVRALL